MSISYSGTIKSLQDILDIIDKANLYDKEHSYLRNWFRGQTRHFDLQPGVYRNGFNVGNEEKRLLKEQHLSQDFRVQSAGLFKNPVTDTERYFVQQHYGMPTRLLDWSTSPLSALYFATLSNDDHDGEIYIMDAFQLSETQKAQSSFRGVITSRHPFFEQTLNVILRWQTLDKFTDYIIPIRPDLTDVRINQQKGYFTFHVPKHPGLSTQQNNSLKVYQVSKDSKPQIRKQLKMLGIDAFNVFHDLESLAKTIKSNHNIT